MRFSERAQPTESYVYCGVHYLRGNCDISFIFNAVYYARGGRGLSYVLRCNGGRDYFRGVFLPFLKGLRLFCAGRKK